MPPYQVFALDDWIQKHVPKCKITLHDSMVLPFTLDELQSLDPTERIISPDASLTYASAHGKAKLREHISLLYSSTDGTNAVKSENILVTSGAISANQLVLETLISPGDRVLVQHPTYNQLIEIPRRAGADVQLWRQKQAHGDGSEFPYFSADIEALEKQLDEFQPKLLILNNPSNPTGFLLVQEQLERILDLCSSRGVLVHCDEVFRFLHHEDNTPVPPSILQLGRKGCIAVSSMSKSFALPGIRVGWIAVSSDLRETILGPVAHANDYTTIAVGCIDQDIATFALRPDIKDKILQRSKEISMRNLTVLQEWATRNKDHVTPFKPRGAGTCVVKLGSGNAVIDDAEFVKKLVETEKVFAPPAGKCFGDQADGSGNTQMEGFLRIGTGGQTQKLKDGLDAIERLLKNWGK